MRTFWIVWSGQAVSLVGSQASQFALVWWLTEQTGSAAVLSTATLVALLPSVVLGPAIGALIDRWSRRLTMIAADAAVALGSLVLAALFLAGNAGPAVVLLFILWRAVGAAFHSPAMQAATSLMVPAEHLGRVQGANQMLQGGIGILAPPLGAVLLGVIGMSGVLALDVVTALFAVLPLLVLAIPEPKRSAESAGGTAVWQDIRAGLGTCAGSPATWRSSPSPPRSTSCWCRPSHCCRCWCSGSWGAAWRSRPGSPPLSASA